jgi:hypothetical protein
VLEYTASGGFWPVVVTGGVILPITLSLVALLVYLVLWKDTHRNDLKSQLLPESQTIELQRLNADTDTSDFAESIGDVIELNLPFDVDTS